MLDSLVCLVLYGMQALEADFNGVNTRWLRMGDHES
jgi:hypothetical protein